MVTRLWHRLFGHGMQVDQRGWLDDFFERRPDVSRLDCLCYCGVRRMFFRPAGQ